MKRYCPHCGSRNRRSKKNPGPKIRPIIRRGSFYRSSDKRRIVRYYCKVCKKGFSSASFSLDFRQKRRDLNELLVKMLCSGISQRRSSLVLAVNRKTVIRKFKLLALRSKAQHEIWLKKFDRLKVTEVQFDDLETSEHTKCKPVSVTLAVKEDSREILGFRVSRMPAKGHLAKISRRKYGYRKDERHKNWDELLYSLKSGLEETVCFKSDENPHYRKPIKKHFPRSTHQSYPGARGAVNGQGELKKLKFDPLFSLNHTCAMLRANLNRLFRRTWCISKTLQGLEHHLWLYVTFHNLVLLHSGTSKGTS